MLPMHREVPPSPLSVFPSTFPIADKSCSALAQHANITITADKTSRHHRFCHFRCSTSPSLLRNYTGTRYWGALTGHTHANCRAVMSVATAVDSRTQDQELLDLSLNVSIPPLDQSEHRPRNYWTSYSSLVTCGHCPQSLTLPCHLISFLFWFSFLYCPPHGASAHMPTYHYTDTTKTTYNSTFNSTWFHMLSYGLLALRLSTPVCL